MKLWLKRHSKLLLLAGTLSGLLAILPLQAQAISDPDAGYPAINAVYAYQHCLEDDDQLYLIDYTVDYTSNPDENITEAYIFRLMNGSAELGSISAYAYYDEGYDRGMASIYFDADDAPTWNGSYTMELVGNPTLYWQDATASSAMSGAVADDGGSQTDETSESNSAAANDMTLLPATPAVDDAYYFSDSAPFGLLTINIGTQGDGTWAITWEYYDGDSWESLSGVTDGTSAFEATTGNKDVSFTIPSDWEKTTIESIEAYWIRARVSTYSAVTTQPLGTQSWTNVASAPPIASVSTFDLWSSSTTQGATEIELGARVLYFADLLELQWSVDLIETASTGSWLTDYGADYFTNSIEDLATICPNVFSAELTQPIWPEADDVPTPSYATSLRTAIVDTPLDLSDVASIVGMDAIWFTTLLYLAIMAVAAWGVSRVAGSVKPVILVMAGLIPVGVMIGWVDLLIGILMGFAALVAIAYVFFLQKSSA